MYLLKVYKEITLCLKTRGCFFSYCRIVGATIDRPIKIPANHKGRQLVSLTKISFDFCYITRQQGRPLTAQLKFLQTITGDRWSPLQKHHLILAKIKFNITGYYFSYLKIFFVFTRFSAYNCSSAISRTSFIFIPGLHSNSHIPMLNPI